MKRNFARAILLIIAVIILAGIIMPDKIVAGEPLQVITVIVEPGDSLWKIAERYDDNSMDLRKYIHIIKEYNHLKSSQLQPGQIIKVPIYGEQVDIIALTLSQAR